MSKKSSKLDLLVRVRFENPLPDPPFPPKLLKLDTDITRLGDPAYLDQLATSTTLPMVLDSEMGMPIDLSAFPGVFDGSDAALNPTPDSKQLEPEDALLLTPLKVLAGGVAPKPEVSWMRNSSYIQRTDRTRRRAAIEAQQAEVVDASETAQILAIEKSFTDLHATELKDIRHPDAKRKHLRVVESYDILPDEEAWSNSYILFKYPERPNAATATDPGAKATRERLERALLRPVVEDDQQLVDYFLPPEAELGRLDTLESEPLDAEALERLADLGEDEDVNEVYPNVTYDRIRTYEVVNQATPQKEWLLSFCEDAAADEEDMFGDDEPVRKKRKGVYFKEISMRSQLRKTRAQRRGDINQRADVWDKVRVAFRAPDEAEKATREVTEKAVTDPTWVEEQLDEIRRGGEGEEVVEVE